MRRLGDPFFGIFLNPGHLIGLDEWINSPFAAGSTVELRSGMAFQADVIPATGTDYFTTNIEDGVALADESLRAAFAAGYPEAWARIQARRRFMRESLGIELHDDVLPLSNLAAHLPPFVLRPDRAMTLAGLRQPASVSGRLEQVGRDQPAQDPAAGLERPLDVDPDDRALAHRDLRGARQRRRRAR